MTWPRWQHFDPRQRGRPGPPAKVHKYHAHPVIVTEDLQVIDAELIRRTADDRGIKTDRLVRVKGKRGVRLETRPRPLPELAVEIGCAGIWFASAKEARRWVDLRGQEAREEIRNLRRQVRYPLHVRNPEGLAVEVALFIADFVYVDDFDGREICEDCKGMATETYLLKRRWMEAEYGIKIRET